METILQKSNRRLSSCVSLLIAVALLAAASVAGNASQSLTSAPAPRISSEIANSARTQLRGSLHPLAQPKYDTGRLAASTQLKGISIFFSRTTAQEADLRLLMTAQQDPTSPLYHQWLTPEQFASRFGMADSDIAKVQSWLEQQGFSVDSVARGKDIIRFSGNAGLVESAFSTEMHTYTITVGGKAEKHFAPSTALSVPTALAGVIFGVRDLDNFRPRSHMKVVQANQIRPQFTEGSGDHDLAPGDIATIYDINPLYNSGITGEGQTIAIVGQSDVNLSDVASFRSAAGLPALAPTKILVPGTGAAFFSAGDESESDLDLEWSGAIAKAAQIDFIYAGDTSSGGAFDSLVYAIDQRIAPIISSSYGDCETDLGATLETVFEQAAAQGQTIIASSGDEGSTDCFEDTDLPVIEEGSLAVDYPASSPNVTGVGGTQFNGDGSGAGSYWSSSNSSSNSSATSYIPEVVWNEDSSANGLSASGGGESALFAKPAWQAGTGVPADGARDVPDIAIDAANDHDPYLFCSSDVGSQGVNGPCTNGFLNSSSATTLAGGTSFSAPIFAGILALINQKQNSNGQGLINTILYQLAANSSVYASAFHDITSGNNDCTAGSGFCLSTDGFSANAGYDAVTGLGTIDANNLAAAWPASAPGTQPSLAGSVTTITASATAPALSQSVTLTVKVAASSGAGTPSGTVSFTVDGTVVSSQTLASGSATFSTQFTAAGNHIVQASYSGDSTYAASNASVSINVLSTAGSFTISPATSTVTVSSSTTCSNSALDGNKANAYCDVITVTPSGGYAGAIDFQATTTNATLAQEGCWNWDQATVSGGTVTSGTIYISVNSSFCSQAGVPMTGSHRPNQRFKLVPKTTASQPSTASSTRAGIWTISLLVIAMIGFRARRMRGFAAILFIAAISFGISACGGGGSGSTPVNPTPPGSGVSVIVTGTDTVSPSLTATTTLSVTVQ